MSETIDSSSHALAMVTVLDQSQESHIDQLHRAAIGPVNTGYYLPILARFEAYDRGSPSWNWAASLCTLNWMAFRGLWRPALAYLATLVAAALGLMALTHFATGMAESIRWGLWSALATLALLVPGFFGNIWLFNNHRKRLARALAATPTLRDACLQLSRQASSRQRLMGLGMANGVLAIALASAWFWYPRHALHDTARLEHGGAVLGTAAPASAASAAAVPASTPASSPAIDGPSGGASAPGAAATSPPMASAPSAAASPQVEATAAADAATPAPVPLPATAASAAVATAVAPEPAASDAPPAAAPQSAAPAAPPRLSQAATRHAAIASRSRKAHSTAVVASAPQAAAAAATAPASAARSAAIPEAPARATAAPKRAPDAAASVTPTAPASRATTEGRFQINVGLFAQRDNAQRAFDRLQAAGLPATTQELSRNGGSLTRVRVGPFASREQADAAAQRIRALQLDAVVVRP